ncbi:acetyl-CoA carboxylase biotin carboxylase subunit [bacterium]|nr:acetyl-CoA carboxylase biotin carboxylase subunit [bacterium]
MKRIFIANRGEIAVRVIRACREMHLTAVVGYSDADRASLAVRLADEAYQIGPASSLESYLNIPRLIEVMQETQCDAVHPGYGFLAERSAFAAACEEAGITFIGPRSKVIEMMGNKIRARLAVHASGTPVVPGTMEPLKDIHQAHRFAEGAGFPLMIKAVAGGGGKGMRLARNSMELEEGFRLAQSEAGSAFGDSSVYLEKKIENPHHVEVQILADHQGNIIHLGERECSIQRRHQKVIEESPSPFINQGTREKMTTVAVNAAKEIGYTNAGTMEFLVDVDQNFYFLEMNTRLQVEHPVTECVTGVDVVKEQIRIAAGQALSYSQKDILFRGAAIECRIYAEDPQNNFMPSPGKISGLRIPGGPGIRDDSGIYEGYEVSIHYDPLLSKLAAWGENRREAIDRMKRALEEYQVLGIKTTIPFYERVMRDAVFLEGNVTTSFVDEILSHPEQILDPPLEEIAIVAAAIAQFESLTATPRAPQATNAWRSFARIEGLRS